ncbi:hypothetical protein ILUMI_01171 [Ignelater luminosus]|uniref:Transcription factor Adf-1 n=1 Tax=Ignelater luminosus TaxID=2038154 RepID=A0A8K0DF43_IGNLU|nr:hypothetical protein ILUMI_01171 [Ignelater luminosus]
MKEENVFNIRLLKEIEKYPCLYNYNLTEYTSREITDKAWSDIADKFKKTPDECKQRWKNLRGSLTRNLSQRLKSSYGNKKPKTFYLTKYMQFVMPFAKSRYGYTYEELKLRGETTEDSSLKEDSNSKWEISKGDIDFLEEDEEASTSISEPPIVLTNSVQIPSTSGHLNDPLETRISEQAVHNDADRHFLLSLLPHINCFTPNEKLQFQIKTLNIIDEIMNKREDSNKD